MCLFPKKTKDDGGDEVEHKKQRPRFKFNMENIPIGSELVFTPTGIKVKVASDDQISAEKGQGDVSGRAEHLGVGDDVSFQILALAIDAFNLGKEFWRCLP